MKRLLLHSGKSTGIKELVDLKNLAEEYLRINYHGIKATYRQFTATLNTQYDRTINAIELIPQEIGKVLLSLYRNAFYSVAARK